MARVALPLFEYLRQPDIPSDYLNGASQILCHLTKLFVLKAQPAATLAAGQDFDFMESSDLFRKYMAAARARDWPQVTIIQHEICSP